MSYGFDMCVGILSGKTLIFALKPMHFYGIMTVSYALLFHVCKILERML